MNVKNYRPNGRYVDDDAERTEVVSALRDHGEPMTSREIRLVTMESEAKTRRVLSRLCERGDLVRYRAPSDRRVVVYGLPRWYPDALAHGSEFAFDETEVVDA